jgi:serine/threonine protein kinase
VTEEISSAVFSTGRQIAGYQIEAELGRGGMAIVYRARDINLGRIVALKILAPQLASDDSFRQRFIHESRAAAAVDHPHIIPVFDAGQAGGELFIAMRYVSTGDVRTLLDAAGALPVARAAAIVAQVASALDAAHAHGLVHRDVKPANMLLAQSADGSSDHVYLSDFGLSKQSLAPTGLTAAGQFLGTLDYIAPEQIEGRPVDGRADLYALACATVEMLTGVPPFRRDGNVALMYAQLSEPPPLLRERRPELPAAIDQVMGKALAKSPGDRYAGCMDFAAALKAACTPQGVPRTVPVPPRLPVPPRVPAPPRRPAAPRLPGAPPVPGPPPVPPRPLSPPPGGPVPASWFRDAPPAAAQLNWPPDPTAALAPASRAGAPWRPGTDPSYQGGPPPRRRTGARMLVLPAVLIAALIIGAVAFHLAGQNSAAAPPATLSSSSAPPASSASSDPESSGPVAARTPSQVVQSYFAALNQHDFRAAWQIGGRNAGGQNAHATYAKYVAGYRGTASDVVQILSVSGNVVTARVTAGQTDGTVKVYQGTYTVTDGQITGFDVKQRS